MMLFFAMVVFGLLLAVFGAMAGVLSMGIAKFFLWMGERRAAAKRARGLS